MSFYKCDPIKNGKCKKTTCFLNDGNCYLITHKKFALSPEPFEGDKMDKTCMNCKKALKRGQFSFKRYGAYYLPYECCKSDSTAEMWKRADDTCADFEGKRPKERG